MHSFLRFRFPRFRNLIFLFRIRFGKHTGAVFLFFFLFLLSFDTFARMGGGGGGGGGDSDIGILDLIYLIFFLLVELPFPFNILSTIAVIAFIYWAFSKHQESSVLNELPAHKKQLTPNQRDILAFTRQRPDFDTTAFLAKVQKVFLDIQNAWSTMNIAPVRRFLSDGMYQRVNTQFSMMRILNQRNTIENMELKETVIDRIESDGRHDIIHVAVHAVIKEQFTSSMYPNLNSTIHEEFIEYWSFIRKTTAVGKDMYHEANCPNCGGDIRSNLGEISRCPYCGTLTNAGDYDWVLAKITPADDYRLRSRRGFVQSLDEKIEALFENDPEFSVLKLEDKASNAFLQLETARILKNSEPIRRFTNDAYAKRFADQITRESDFVYNRMYLNDVALIGAMQKNNRNVLAVNVKFSFQRVQLQDNHAHLLDPVVTSQSQVMIFERDIKATSGNASVVSHECPLCGAPLSDTTDVMCPYCGGMVRASLSDWIVCDVMSPEEYNVFYTQNKAFFSASIAPAKLEAILKVRDYAFNNVLMMLFADKTFTEEEEKYIRKLARKWGYAPDRLTGLLDMAKNNQLVLRIPEKPKDREKVYRKMCKAAAVDNNIAPQEQNLLDFYRHQAHLKIPTSVA